jgi:hypothetical protein
MIEVIMRKTLIIMALTLLGAFAAGAQEVTSYETDSTAYYNAVYNPNNDYAQAPIRGPQRKVNSDRNRLHTTVNTGVGISGGGSYEFVNPTFNYDLSKKWSLNFGMGVSYSNLKLRTFANSEDGGANYQNLRAISNYYSAGATYRASERLSLYGDLIYAKTMPVGGGDNPFGYNNDAYMARFGATYQINKSLSVGFEMSTSRNVNPYGAPGNPYGIIYNNPYSPW